MFFVYVIASEAKGLRFYVGMSENVDKRLLEHTGGKTKFTKGYVPWKLFLTEKYSTRIGARDSIAKVHIFLAFGFHDEYLMHNLGLKRKKIWHDR